MLANRPSSFIEASAQSVLSVFPGPSRYAKPNLFIRILTKKTTPTWITKPLYIQYQTLHCFMKLLANAWLLSCQVM